MGYYINPKDGSQKEEWLDIYATQKLLEPPVWSEVIGSCLPVCLVDNGPFTAAAIAYDEREFNEFKNDENDFRLKTWFVVKKYHLAQFLPERITKDDCLFEYGLGEFIITSKGDN